jgi:hypothetical protein
VKEKRKYALMYQGSRVICPVCSGLMNGEPMMKTCNDCHRSFKAVDSGFAENELIYEEVVVA